MHFDGCSKGNPGPSGIGAVISKLDIEEWCGWQYIGKKTNNQSEYSALILGLNEAISRNIKELQVYGDSLLVINQVTGQFKVKNNQLQELYKEAMTLIAKFDYIVLLDVIEHLKNPELFMEKLYNYLEANYSSNKNINIIISTPNIGFFYNRFSLLFGNFNYGTRGILDMTHYRLFTEKTFTDIINQSNFIILKNENIIPPYSLIFKNKILLFILYFINKFFIKLFPNMFSYQFLKVVTLNNSIK